jgi:hypothetical protein
MDGVASPEQLVELLSAAARTPGGEVGLLKTAQVARILGRRRDWVHANAGRLGGFRLPGSDEWRFSPRGVAIGIFGPHDDKDPTVLGTPRTRPSTRRLAYPPAKQTLADRPRRASSDVRGAADAPPGTRQR